MVTDIIMGLVTSQLMKTGRSTYILIFNINTYDFVVYLENFGIWLIGNWHGGDGITWVGTGE